MYYYEYEKRFLKLEEIKDVGLPIIDDTKNEDYVSAKMSWFTYTDMKKIIELELTDKERRTCVVAFEKCMNGRGYVPLYCFVEIFAKRKREREEQA